MVKTAKQTKRQLRHARAEARAAAIRRRRQRRRLAWALGGAAVAGALAIGVIALMSTSDDGTGGVTSTRAEVLVDGPARGTLLGPGETVPDFSAPALAGGSVAWNDFAGAPAVIAVWAPWCPHCQVELPVLDRVMKDHPDVAFLSVVTSIDLHPGPTPQQYMSEHGLSFPVAVDDDEGTIARALGISGFPTLYFVGSDGAVVRAVSGEVPEDTLHAVIVSLT
jgi:thiol-disulfide isomerase/thioredoxin